MNRGNMGKQISNAPKSKSKKVKKMFGGGMASMPMPGGMPPGGPPQGGAAQQLLAQQAAARAKLGGQPEPMPGGGRSPIPVPPGLNRPTLMPMPIPGRPGGIPKGVNPEDYKRMITEGGSIDLPGGGTISSAGGMKKLPIPVKPMPGGGRSPIPVPPGLKRPMPMPMPGKPGKPGSGRPVQVKPPGGVRGISEPKPTPGKPGSGRPMPGKPKPGETVLFSGSGMAKGGAVKKMAKGGKANKIDGCCMKGHTKGMMK